MKESKNVPLRQSTILEPGQFTHRSVPFPYPAFVEAAGPAGYLQ